MTQSGHSVGGRKTSAYDPKRTFIGICGSAHGEVTHHPNHSDRLPAGRLPLSTTCPRPDLWTLRGADSRTTGGVCARGGSRPNGWSLAHAGGYPFFLFGCAFLHEILIAHQAWSIVNVISCGG